MNSPIAKLPPPSEVKKQAHAALRLELSAMRRVIRALDKCSQEDQARVMLWAITKYAPNAFSDTQLLTLVRKAQGPTT